MPAHVQVECPCGRSLRVAPGGGPVIRCWDCRAELKVPRATSMGRRAVDLRRIVGDLTGSGMPLLLLFAALLLAHASAIPRVELWGFAGVAIGSLGLLVPSSRLDDLETEVTAGRPLLAEVAGRALDPTSPASPAFGLAPTNRIDGPHPLPPVSWCWPSSSPSGRVAHP